MAHNEHDAHNALLAHVAATQTRADAFAAEDWQAWREADDAMKRTADDYDRKLRAERNALKLPS